MTNEELADIDRIIADRGFPNRTPAERSALVILRAEVERLRRDAFMVAEQTQRSEIVRALDILGTEYRYWRGTTDERIQHVRYAPHGANGEILAAIATQIPAAEYQKLAAERNKRRIR